MTLDQLYEHFSADKGWYHAVHPSKNVVLEYAVPERIYPFGRAVIQILTGFRKSGQTSENRIRICTVDLKNRRGLMRTKEIHHHKDWRKESKEFVVEVLKNLSKRQS